MPQFRGRLWKGDEANAWVVLDVPPAISAALGERGRMHVRGTLAGAPFASTLLPNGNGTHLLHVSREMLANAEVAPGDVVEVVFQRTAPPRLVVPRALSSAIAK